ncbi:MAG TPA: sugar ABC transporter ATP-binding protein [Candidatus Angelobacter sp.]|jgi:D-xylose transport system ATP-binding protein
MTVASHPNGGVNSLYRDGRTLVNMSGITKNFPGTRALKGVNLEVQAGEIHALVGENGAGKSTLIKILAGIYPASQYEGEIRIGGKLERFRGIHDAEAAGVGVVHQELSLVPDLSVAENIFLGRIPQNRGIVRWNEMLQSTREWLSKVGLHIDPETPVSRLGIAQQQLVEIAKALSHRAQILVLDEPTSALTGAESETLFSILRDLAAQGAGIIYISHRLVEVFDLSDRITVLRDGMNVATEETKMLDQSSIVRMMVGREMSQLFPAARNHFGEVVFAAQNVSLPPRVRDVSFSVRRGEVLGIAGLMGAGRSELLMAMFGASEIRPSGQVLVEGRQADIRSPRDAIKHGIAFVTEDRRRFGLVLGDSILHNLTLPALRQISNQSLTSEPNEMALGDTVVRDLQIKASSLLTAVGALSGGNQQKVVLGKWLMTKPKVLFLDEPTRGIDVGAKEEFYRRIDELAKHGLAIVLVSSELEEIMGLSDRILVLHQGAIVKEFSRAGATSDKIMACAIGHPELA